MAKILGIDLGTTNSAMAYSSGRRPRGNRKLGGGPHHTVDRRRQTRRPTSAMLAKWPSARAITNPENTIFSVKRLMGRKYDDDVAQKDITSLPYKVVKSNNGDAQVSMGGKNMSPPEVSAMILRKLKGGRRDQVWARASPRQ